MCPAFPGSEYYQRIRLHIAASAFLRNVPYRPAYSARSAPREDRSGSLRFLTLPSLSVPCSLTPPQSPATIALYGDLLLPSSHYNPVGLRILTFTRLNRFTFVTARSSLCTTLNPCRCLHKPKVRFPVGRLIPLSEAGISPAESVRLSLTHHSAGKRSRGRARSRPLAGSPRSCGVGDRFQRLLHSAICRSSVG